MTISLLLLGALAVSGIVASLVVVSRDGYRRQPTRPLASTYRDTPEAAGAHEPPEVRPSDIIASQWLRDAETASVRRHPRPRHAAGGMVLRPW